MVLFAGALVSSARAYDPNRRSPGTIANGNFSPQLPAASQLGPDPSIQCPKSPYLADLEKKLSELAKQKKLPLAEKDGQLCEVADTFLGYKDDGSVPAHLAQAVGQHLGLPFRPEVRLASFETADIEAITPALFETVGNFMANAASPRFGLVVERKRAGGGARDRNEKARVALALMDAPVTFQPFPRKLDAGASATVAGQVQGSYSAVKVLVSDEAGALSTPEQAPGTAFRAEVKCGEKPGRVTVEVHGEGSAGSRTLCAVAIQCGGQLPAAFAIARPAWPKDAAGQEQKMAEAINAERAEIGLSALEYDPALAGVARTVAEKLRDALAEGRAPMVDTGALLKDAGLASPVLLQNPGEAPTAEEAQTRFSLSPSTRQNLLSAEVNHMGIGLAAVGEAGGPSTVLVTQLFTKVLPTVDVAEAKKELYAEVQKKREEFKSPEATVDPQIDKVAQQYAEAMAKAGGKLSNEEADELTHSLRQPYKSINMIEGAKGSVADFLKDTTVTWDGTAMGAGVAQGTHPVLGKNALFIVFVVATPRPPEKAPAETKSTPVVPKPTPKPKVKKAQ
jgi:uncharacterized protein YkwD